MKEMVLALALFLCFAWPAGAALSVLVDGELAPPGSEIWLNRGDVVVLEVTGDGGTQEPLEGFLFIEGPGAINGHTLEYPGAASEYHDLEQLAETMEMTPEQVLAAFKDSTGRDLTDLSKWILADNGIPPNALFGELISGIEFRCEGAGDVFLTLQTDDELTTYPDYTVVIHQTAVTHTYYVDAATGDDSNTGLGPEEAFATIQRAIDSAYDGEAVIVQPGMYAGGINFLGKNLVLRSAEPNDSSTIEQTVLGSDSGAGELETTITFRGDEGPSCRLWGFNINGHIQGSDPSVDPSAENHTHATISNCRLCNNFGDCSTVIRYCDGLIENCIIAGNNMSACGLADAAVEGCHGLIRNCTFANNLTRYAVRAEAGGTTKIENCILHDAGVLIDAGGVADISYSSLQGCAFVVETATIVWCDLSGNEGPVYCDGLILGPGNISAETCLVRVGDGREGIVGDYHLKSRAGRWDRESGGWVYDADTSRCIDAGNPGSPLGDEPKNPRNRRINMGAYGGTGEGGKTPANWSLLADLTNDGIVDGGDFAYQAKDRYVAGEEYPGDLNRNGYVEIDDIAALFGAWLRTTSWH